MKLLQLKQQEVFVLFIYLVAPVLYLQQAGSLVVACKLSVAACMWDLVPRPGIEPKPTALGAWSLLHCTTREVSPKKYLFLFWHLTFRTCFPHPALPSTPISHSFWGPRCKRRWVFKDREKGGRKSPREPLFHLKAARYRFLQNSELTVHSPTIINFIWPAGSQRWFLCKELLGALPHPPRLQPSPHHSYPGVSQNIGLGNGVTFPPAWGLRLLSFGLAG